MHELEDYCRSVITRQHKQSVNLHDLYTDNFSKYEEMIDGIKSSLPRLLLSNHNNVGWIIANVGDDLFSSRPATLPYVLTFLEFVSLVYREINGRYPWMDDHPSQATVPLPIFTYSATLAIAKTTFIPPPPPPPLRQVYELCNIL